MISVTHRLYTADQVRQLDRYAIEQEGMPGYELMLRAGRRAYRELLRAWPEAERILLCCGPGNNGGDAYVLARLALRDRKQVQLIQLGDVGRIRGEAAQARQAYLDTGGTETSWQGSIDEADVIVDALFGTGLEREIVGDFGECILAINSQLSPVQSIDIPSGLNADTGMPLGIAVKADMTVSFVGQKRGLHTGAALDYRGQLIFDDLGVPSSAFASVESTIVLADKVQPMVRRPMNSHKGDYGHVVIVGGGLGMPGAAMMAGKAALRCGAGRVTVLTAPEHAALIPMHCPELMALGIEQPADARPVLEQATSLVIGPGLGQTDWARQVFDTALEYPLPTVLDADALNMLAASSRTGANWVITPHPGEAARLLNQDAQAVQADRFSAVRLLQERYKATTVLKGAGSLIAGSDELTVCAAGNPGMATAGMGDILSGVIGALLAQGYSADDAARAGVCLHACAGDKVAESGQQGMMATDLLDPLRELINP